MKKKLLIAAAVAGVLLSTSGCSGKFSEPFKDAGVQGRNSAPATVGTMPDGFGNWAFKCGPQEGGPNGIYTLFHSDGAYGGISVVPNDPACRP